jgi:site-specific recombinase XerD
MHAFRRSVATDLQHSAAAVAVAQGALRHSDAATTQRWYVKQVPELVTEAIQRRADEGIFVDGHLRTPKRALKG